MSSATPVLHRLSDARLLMAARLERRAAYRDAVRMMSPPAQGAAAAGEASGAEAQHDQQSIWNRRGVAR
eukprot:SAG31_NODE_1416_length_8441_cov_11.436706_3_plen_69_part_00